MIKAKYIANMYATKEVRHLTNLMLEINNHIQTTNKFQERKELKKILIYFWFPKLMNIFYVKNTFHLWSPY